jgi:hypothetical protein
MAGAGYLRVDVSGVDWQPRLDQPGWRQIQVGGRPARIVSRPTRTLIDWQLSSGRWANLEYGRGMPGEAAAQPDVERIAERVAAGITEGAPEPVRVRFAPTVLPEGTRVVGVRGVSHDGYGTVDVASGSQRVVRTGQVTTQDGIGLDHPVLDETGLFGVSFHPGPFRPNRGETRTDDIQGQPAYLLNEGRGIAFDSPPHGNVTVAATGEPAPFTPEAVRRVAEGVRWTG